MRLLLLLLLTLSLFQFGNAQNQVPQIENVQTCYSDNILNLSFDVIDAENDLVDITFSAGDDGDLELNLDVSNATGDLGTNLTPGAGKSISWDFSNYSGLAPDFRIMITVDDNQPVDFQALANEIDSQELLNFLTAIEGIRHRNTGATQLSSVQNLIRSEFESSGLETTTQIFGFGGYTAENIIGRMIGTADMTNCVIIDAHYDSVFDSPGADDNASGVSGVLESLRVLSGYSFDKSIKFIGFDLEEDGLAGSNHYALNLNPSETTVAVLNYEMIGYYSNQPNSQTIPPGFGTIFPAQVSQINANNNRGDFIAVSADLNSTAISAAFQNAAASYVPGLTSYALDIPVNSTLVPDLRRSDHASFWDVGIPAIMISDGANFRNPFYHEPEDTIGSLDTTFMAQVVRATTITAAQLAGIRHAATYWEDVGLMNSARSPQKCQFQLSPNPTKEYFRLFSNECAMTDLTITIRDVNGRMIKELQINGSDQEIVADISDLIPGFYSVQISSSNFDTTEKLIVQ
jgi:hypothetical protein